MFKLFEYIFINRKYNNTDMTVKKRSAYGKLASFIGILCNILLCVVKIIAGLVSQSISLTADGINNLTDSLASLTTLIGFKLASTPADDKHPFGHERIEYISGMFVSMFILLVGVLLGKGSIEKIISKEQMDLDRFYLLIAILVFSILVKLWMGLVYRKVGKKINSQAIYATSQDSLNDCIASFAVLISLIVAKFTSFNVDGYLGVLVSIFILVNGVKLMMETISPLIGEAYDPEEVNKIINVIKSYEGVLGIHDLVVHQYGPKKIFMTVHVEVDSQVDIMISHETIDSIERDIQNQYGVLLTIHLDPIDRNDEFTNSLRDALSKVVSNFDNITFHDFRIVKGEKSVNVLFDIVRPFNCSLSENELKERIVELFIEKAREVNDLTYRLIVEIDSDYVRMEK